jgi:hypothetical protein
LTDARPPAADSVVLVPSVTLVGVVRDSSGRALANAEVRAGAELATMSDDRGRFSLPGVPPDTIQVLVRRIGYLPANVVLAADPGTRVELAVNLVPSAVELGTIIVEGRRMSTHLNREGFYARQARGFGTHFGPEELERHAAMPLTGFLSMVPSVSVERGAGGRAVAWGSGGAGRQCPLTVYLDGVVSRWATDAGLDNIVNRHDILGIEVYSRSGELATAYGATGQNRSDSRGGFGSRNHAILDGEVVASGEVGGVSTSDCGALMIWTKPPGSR